LEGSRLDYKEGHYWQVEILFNEAIPFLQYKFVLCREDEKQKPICVLEWEEGKNHCLNLQEMKEKKKTRVERRDWWDMNICQMMVKLIRFFQSK